MNPVCKIYGAEVSALVDPDRFRRGLELVPEQRREKIFSLRGAESQRLSLGVGLLLVLALEERGMDGREVRIRENAYGKPCLADWPELRFNLSHSGAWALCVLWEGEAGCDVERVGRGSERLVRRFFHPSEQAALASLGSEREDAWQRRFTHIWTRKESYLKALGTGVNRAMNGFSVTEERAGVAFDHREWDPEYDFCCCALGESPVFDWKRPNLAEWIDRAEK